MRKAVKKSKTKVKAKTIKKKAVKKLAGSKLKLLNLKVGSKDRALLLEAASKYAKGNLSAWLRHAGKKYIPSRSEVVQY